MINEAQENPTLQNASNFIRGRIAKDICNRLIENKIEKHSSESYFENNFNIVSEDRDKIYMLPFCTTIENKLRAFQFKINPIIFYHNKK